MSWILDSEVLAVLAAIVIVSSVFAGVQLLAGERVVEPFSELGLLGPRGLIGDYPREAAAGSPFQLNIYIGNREGRAMYYRVLAKLGNASLTVNETAPLQAEPIAEVRAVLTHGSSRVIPVNITVSEPAVNARLVFEMWVFNETVGTFTYHGRWNQLWLNVTPAHGGAEAPPKAEPDWWVEHALTLGYLAVRRAEKAGGNISAMVELLNRALELAAEGRGDEAESLVSQVLAMEPEVSRLGAEARRLRLYTGIAALAAATSAGVAGYLLLRRRVWLWWASLNGECRVFWVGGAQALDPVERAIRDGAKPGGVSLRELVFSSAGYAKHEVARAVYGLARRGAVKLVDPSPPGSFGSFLFSRYNLGFAIAALLVALCFPAVYLSNLSAIAAASRVVLGSLLVLFLPGYSLVEALYPGEGDLEPLERLALSVGLSLALVPLVGLLLNYTPWGIRLDPVIAALSTLTLSLLLLASYRKYRLLASGTAARPRAAQARGGR